ncbi:hypothetical protein SAMN05660652_03749 [Propionivibrio dicarboxylicus]|uniref:Uncharacterized protein n=1 Tax=Propionivibrio dicarboxylicus TaxID=83767 RepID=A0A1G8M0U7_9RHOO|nr:hypothetical protein SAMN05660652_03749 [Propionivibrio dicarboxylicus]
MLSGLLRRSLFPMPDALAMPGQPQGLSDALSMLYYRFGSTLFLAFLDDPAWIAFWFC